MESKFARVRTRAQKEVQNLKFNSEPAPASLASSGEEVALPVKISEDPKMADAKEMIQQMRQMLNEGMDRHIESFRAKEEENSRKHRESIEEQKRAEREDRETITKKLEQLRIEKSKARGKETLRLPQYDGTNLDIDDWQENVEAIAKFNGWDLPKLLEILPISLGVHAKWAFDSLLEVEK